ncbi:MAG: TIR domain-containing protein [Chloroflexi bacterium]|nr:TIR domain-containing protein [Chloroflexota bacterium]
MNYDLFVSYADADRAWVEGYLLDALEQAGVRCMSEAAFTLGAPRLLEFERAVKESGRTLLVLSPAYLAESFAQFTDLLAQSYGMETATWPVIPLILAQVALPPRLAMLQALDASDPDRRPAAIERLCAVLQHPVPAQPPKPACPYPGMVPFTEADASKFFGRDHEIQELLDRLRLHPFVAVIGPSGSGKSSLVFAGLIPALRQSGLFGPGDWIVKSMRPGETPLGTLAQTSGVSLPSSDLTPRPSFDKLRTGSSLPGKGETSTPSLAGEGLGERSLLVVDQFEELFTHQPKDAVAFEQALCDLARRPNCYVVLTARADFYPDLMNSSLWPTIQAHRFEVLPLDADGLRQAIVRPAEDTGVYVEAALVERLVADAAGEPGALPFVQETLRLLWERLERRFLPLSAYNALVLSVGAYRTLGGATRTGLQVAMAHRADATLADLTPGQQAIARRIFLRLVQFGEGRADTRRQQPVSALRTPSDTPDEFDHTLEHLAGNRLLSLSGEAGDPNRRADIAHDALITGWPTLQGWVAERREAELARRRMEAKAAEWTRLGKGAGGLLDAVELREAERWLAGSDAADLGYAASLSALVDASRRALRRATLLRAGALAVAVVGILSAVLIYAILQRSAAQREASLRRQVQAQLALSQSRQVAAVARNQLDAGEAQQALLLGIAATQQITETVESNNVLREALDAWRGEDILVGHAGRVSHVIFSPNGQYLASISDDKTARIWQVAGERRTLTLSGHAAALTDVLFSADSRRLVTASRDGTARLWEVTDGRLVYTLDHGAAVTSLALNPDGKTLATGGEDNTIRLWDLTTGQSARTEPFRTEGAVQDVTFSPNGILLVAASTDGTAWLWHLPSGQFARLSGHTTVVSAVAFSPDGRYLATRSGDTVRVWDMDGLKPIQLRQAQHGAAVLSLIFSPDSRYLASGSQDATARLWDMRRLDADPTILRGHTEAVWGVLFRPDSRLLATTGWDNAVRLWCVEDGAPEALLTGHTAEIWNSAFSPDGQFLATPDSTGTIRLWRTQAGGELAGYAASPKPITALALAGNLVTVAGDDGMVELWWPDVGATQVYTVGQARLTAVAASGDGALLAVGSADGQIALVDAAQGAVIANWPAQVGAVRALLFLSDGVYLASGGAGGTIRLWDLRRLGTGQPVRELRGHENDVTALAAGGDAATLVSASGDGTARVWNWQTGQQTALFDAGAPLWAVAFSADRRHLAAGGYGPVVKVWDVLAPTGQPISLTHGVPVRALAFSPDGKGLATGAEDGVLRLWNLADGGTVGPVIVRAHVGRWIIGLGYSGDGRTLVSAGGDGQVRVWPATTADALALGCRRAGRALAAEEWQTYLSFLAPGKLCPAQAEAVWQSSAELAAPRPIPAAIQALASSRTADPRPVIRYFEATPGAMVRAGGRVTLRWDVAGATAVYLEQDGKREGVTAPHEETFAPAADTTYRLVAVNAAGERSLTISVVVK